MNYFLGIDTADEQLVADFEEGAGHRRQAKTTRSPARSARSGNVWHHAAATYDGTTWRLYLDGTARHDAQRRQASRPRATRSSTPRSATTLTSTGTAAGFFQGVLDEARIWNVARTGAQIRANRTSRADSRAPAFVARWPQRGHGDAAAIARRAPTTGPTAARPCGIAGYGFPQDTTAPAAPTGLAATPGDNVRRARLERERRDRTWPATTSTGLTSTGSPTAGHAAERRRPAHDDDLQRHDRGQRPDRTTTRSSPSTAPTTPRVHRGQRDPSSPPDARRSSFDGSNEYVTFGAAPGLGATDVHPGDLVHAHGHRDVGQQTGNRRRSPAPSR